MSRVLYESKVGRKFVEEISVFWPMNGGAAPAAANVQTTQECTITYAATGKYTLTFTRPYSVTLGAYADAMYATAGGNYAQVDSVTLNSGGVTVVVVGLYTNAGVAVAPASAASNNNVMLSLTMVF